MAGPSNIDMLFMHSRDITHETLNDSAQVYIMRMVVRNVRAEVHIIACTQM